MGKGSKQRTYGNKYAKNHDEIDWSKKPYSTTAGCIKQSREEALKNAKQLDKWVSDIEKMDKRNNIERGYN